MPRVRKTPEEVSASRRAAVRVLWDRMSPEERSQFSRDRWASVDPERRRELMQSMRAKRIPKPLYRPLSQRKVKPEVEVQSAANSIIPIPHPYCSCGGDARVSCIVHGVPVPIAPVVVPAVPAVPAPPVPEIDYEAIVQGRWYSRIAAAHQDTARANAREWQCACGACRMARMEAN
jgi:hypothetical protein